MLAIFASLFAVLTVVNMSLASPKSAGDNTLNMLEIMTRAFDESEGGGGVGGAPTCNTGGGPGATSCSSSWTIVILGQTFTGSCDVTCGSGYYACCYDNAKDGHRCSCFPNSPV